MPKNVLGGTFGADSLGTVAVMSYDGSAGAAVTSNNRLMVDAAFTSTTPVYGLITNVAYVPASNVYGALTNATLPAPQLTGTIAQANLPGTIAADISGNVTATGTVAANAVACNVAYLANVTANNLAVSGTLTSGAINTQNNALTTGTGAITCGLITSGAINTQNNYITCGPIASAAINTQNNSITTGTGTITCGRSLTLYGPGGGGSTANIDLSTYTPFPGQLPSTRIVATDDVNFSSTIDIQSKVPGSANNALVSRLFISDQGSVGINTNAPTTTLDVNGNLAASTVSASDLGAPSTAPFQAVNLVSNVLLTPNQQIWFVGSGHGLMLLSDLGFGLGGAGPAMFGFSGGSLGTTTTGSSAGYVPLARWTYTSFLVAGNVAANNFAAGNAVTATALTISGNAVSNNLVIGNSIAANVVSNSAITLYRDSAGNACLIGTEFSNNYGLTFTSARYGRHRFYSGTTPLACVSFELNATYDVPSIRLYAPSAASPSALLWNDGTLAYFVVTNANDADGNPNGLRPFQIQTATGRVGLAGCTAPSVAVDAGTAAVSAGSLAATAVSSGSLAATGAVVASYMVGHSYASDAAAAAGGVAVGGLYSNAGIVQVRLV